MHPAHERLLTYFTYRHLPERLQMVAKPFHDLAQELVMLLEVATDGAEVTVCLRKLLEARDCAVRAALSI